MASAPEARQEAELVDVAGVGGLDDEADPGPQLAYGRGAGALLPAARSAGMPTSVRTAAARSLRTTIS